MLHKIVYVDSDGIKFDDGSHLYSYHASDCCESHYLSFDGLAVEDFEGMEFDLSEGNFFERVPDYGIRLVPVNGHSVSIPGYGYNNGYYSEDLTLVLDRGEMRVTFDITDCQECKGDY